MSVLSDGARLDHRPTPAQLRLLRAALAPGRQWFAPRFVGLENIPADGPVLLVGNHTLYGLLDAPLMADGIHRATGRFVRSLAEHAHYRIPPWAELLQAAGAVRGTRDNCRALLAAGELVLVYPGGGREVAKRRGEQYQLLWKERLGFARMAMEAGCPIVPFGAVGAEECYDIVLDADSPLLSPVRRAAEAAGARWELVWPLSAGLAGTPLPRPERFWFAFGTPIPTARYGGRGDSDVAARAVRDATADAVRERIEYLLARRAADPNRRLSRRVATGLATGLARVVGTSPANR